MSKARELANLGNAYSDGALSNRNLIINGAMQVAQRGISSTGVTGAGYQTTDRVAQALSGIGTWTVENSSDAPSNFSRSHKVTCTTANASPAAGAYYILSLRLEGQDLQSLGYGTASAKELSLSFWVKSNKTGAASLELLQVDNSNKLWSSSYTINSADTWEYKTFVIPADTSGLINNDNGTGLELNFWVNSGTTFSSGSHQTSWATYADANRNVNNIGLGGAVNDYIALTGVQLEVGDTATPFEHRSYGDELARCQRYYQRYSGSSNGLMVSNSAGYSSSSSVFYRVGWSFGVNMRSAPTATFNGLSAWDGNVLAGFVAVTTAYATTQKWEADYSCAAALNAGRPVQLYGANTSTYAEFDAEL